MVVVQWKHNAVDAFIPLKIGNTIASLMSVATFWIF
jgi:hypothetical protein